MVRLADDAMAPVFREGDFVFVDPDVPMQPGDFVAVGREGSTTEVRQLVEEQGKRVLRTLNRGDTHCVVTADNETMIRGVAVFWGRKV